MRDLLTGLAIIVIVALTAMLVAPYLVDWNGQRGFLEAQLSRALGQKVTIGGAIDLKLLPTPYLRLNQTVVGGDDGAVRVGIRFLDLELAVAPLLHGEFDIVEGRLDEPTIRLTLQPDRSLPALPDTPALRAAVRLERIRVADGTLAIADPRSGRTLVVDHLDFGADAPSLSGPFKGSGSAGASRTKFRFSTTAAKAGRTHLHFGLDEAATHPSLDLDGTLALSPQGADVRQSFEGTMVAAGRVAEGVTPLSWRLSGPVKADPENLSLGEGELKVGGVDGDAGLVVKASGEASFAEPASFHVQLDAKQLDVDRLAGAPVNAERPPPPHLPAPAELRRWLGALTPPLPTTLEVNVDTAIWGGETLSGLTLRTVLGDKGAWPLAMSGDGPGASHVDVQGTAALDGTFEGHLAAAADDLPGALRWLATIAPDLHAPTTAPVHAADVHARVTLKPNRIEFADLALGVDRSRLTGSATLETAGARPKLAAALKTAKLSLDELPDPRTIDGGAFDTALSLDAGSVDVARVGNGELKSGRLKLDIATIGPKILLRTIEANDLEGATLKASADIDGHATTLSMTVAATRLDALAALARQLAPGQASDAFAARADLLAPANITVGAALAAGAPERLVPSRLDVTGSLGATRVDVHLAPATTSGEISLAASAASDHGGALLGQMGLRTVPLELIGASRVSLVATGRPDRPLDGRVEATLGSAKLAGAGRYDLFGPDPGGAGTLTLSAGDSMALLQTLALAPLDDTNRLPAEATGTVVANAEGLTVSGLKASVDGVGATGSLSWRRAPGNGPTLAGSLDVDRLASQTLFALALGPAKPAASGAAWSNERFAGAPVDLPRSAIALKATALDLGSGLTAENAAVDLALDHGLVTLRHGSARLAGGRIGFDMTLRRDGAQAALEGTLSAQDVRLGWPTITGVASGRLDTAGSGQTPLGLVANLAGTGEASLADAAVTGVNARTLPDVLGEAEADAIPVDEATIRRAFEDAGKGALAFGTRRLAANLAGGVVTLTAKDAPVPIGAVAASLDGSFDLKGWRAEVRVGEQVRALPKNWTGAAPGVTLVERGAPGAAPTRAFEVTSFVNAVAARAIARESARIEAYEFDVRERALFNARLQADRRREQDRLKADADAKAAAEAARQADAESRAKADAARLERQRDGIGTRSTGADGSERGQPAVRPRLEPPSGYPASPGRY